MSKLNRIAGVLACLWVLSGCGAPAGGPARAAGPAEPSGTEKIAGLWGFEKVLGPRARGPISLDGRGGEWRGSVAGYGAPVRREGDSLGFIVPQVGEFRGHITADGKRIFGHWIQPESEINSIAYASPVQLTDVADNVWRGNLVPFDERISFYALIRRGEKSALTAIIRNPERNWFNGRVYDVAVKNGSVVFTNGQQRLEGTYDPETDRLALPLMDNAPPVSLTRRDASHAAGFYPRPPSSSRYDSRPPAAEDDGWMTASPEAVGLDPEPLRALVEKIIGADQGAEPIKIQALLVARHGTLVLEEYFYGFDASRPHDTRSAGKTIAPILLGMALEQSGHFKPGDLVASVFPEYQPFAHLDDSKKRMTVKDLLTMTSGLACDDNDDSSPGGEDRMQQQTGQPDWYKFVLDLPMAAPPGGNRAVYCTAALNLVGGVVRNATRTWLPRYFDERLARPLQFGVYHMNLMPTREAYMGGGIYIRPRDVLKLGQLYLSGGTWNGHRIVSREWVEESTRAYSKFAPAFDFDTDHEYGYAWHIHHLTANGKTHRIYAAEGNGGQMVIVIPDLDMVVGFNGGAYAQFSRWYRWLHELVPQYIFPAAR